MRVAKVPSTPATRPETGSAASDVGAADPHDPMLGRSPSRALARCVGDPDAFAASHWGSAPLHVQSDDALADVLDLADVDAVLTSAARRPEVRMVHGGAMLDPATYCTPRRIGGRVIEDVIDPARLADRFADGATVVLQSLHRTWPSVSRFATELEAAISHPVQVNAYLTPPGAAGLAPHADRHDVIVCQLHGTKQWAVEGLGDLVLAPGDRLFMPAGTRHSATAQAHASLHLTIGILRITYRAVVERVLSAAPGLLDDPLPLGWAHDADDSLDRELPAVLDLAAKTLASADPVEVAGDERLRRRTRTHPGGTIASLVHSTELDHDSVVELVPGQHPTIDTIDADTIRLQLSDRALRLPAISRPALEVLIAGAGPVRVDDLPGIDADSRLVLVRRLIREGMLTSGDVR